MMRNPLIEFYRFVFMCIICLWHFRGVTPLFHSGYLPVEFFFVLSGFLLFEAVKRHPERTEMDWIKSRILKFFPTMLVALIPTFIVMWRAWLPIHINADAILASVNIVFSNILFVTTVDCYGFPINMPLWYLSVNIIVGGVVYSCLRYWGDKFIYPILMPLIFFCITFLYKSRNGILEISYQEIWYVYVRGVMEMGIGVVLARMTIEFSRISDKVNAILHILSVCCFVCCCYSSVHFDFYSLIYVVIIIQTSFRVHLALNKRILNVISLLGGVTFEMLCIHIYVCRVFEYLNLREVLPGYILIPIYLTIVVLNSFCLKYLVKQYNKCYP